MIHENPSSNPPPPAAETTKDNSAPFLESLTSTDGVAQQSEDAILERPIAEKTEEKPLRPLTSLSWPPEPDPSIFTDPLQKEDPKPLRHEELLRIATSKDLRQLLSTSPKLTKILTIIDSIQSSKKRHETISKLLGLDSDSLSITNGITESFLNGRDSPPPLNDLLDSLVNQSATNRNNNNDLSTENQYHYQKRNEWYLTSSSQNQNYQNRNNKDKDDDGIWIGEEEKILFKLFSNSICQSIDGSNENGNDQLAWGQGSLGWEI
ncbi:uncharacterized protein L201_003739 [Kwoniella dendrophila CBS 6074]|uniref:Uncharacterized protein n=1 Tax=Kwoniella dendrophila CBS 6074 TaxID=1295534 RepID=A0AAX4JTR6_9TREE